MIRILQVVNIMNRAGLETMLMNYYRFIDRSKIQFDFLTHRPNSGDYDDEIESLGGKVYHAPRLYPQNYPSYFKWMKKFLKEHSEYRIVHCHIDAMSYLPLLVFSKSNIPVRIAHSHNTSIDRDFKYILKQFFRSRINNVATERFACGKEAGEFLYGEKTFSVIPNAVDASYFYFNSSVRAKKRQEFNITDEFVVGHVGRFYYPKNHMFLVDIFKEILKLRANALLLLVGTGEKEKEIKQYVLELGLERNVKFLGNRNDASELYQAMDAFVLPSLFEGIPLVGVEAQFADLPCFFSDKVPQEVMFNKKSSFISLNETAQVWAGNIISSKNLPRSKERDDILNSRYDIKVAYKKLEDYYLSV